MAVARPQCMLLDGDPTKQVVISAMRLWHNSLIMSGFCLTRPRNNTCTPKVWELDAPFVVRPLRWFFCLVGCGSFHFVPCILPLSFLGALVYLSLAGFHHITTSTNINDCENILCYTFGIRLWTKPNERKKTEVLINLVSMGQPSNVIF